MLSSHGECNDFLDCIGEPVEGCDVRIHYAKILGQVESLNHADECCRRRNQIPAHPRAVHKSELQGLLHFGLKLGWESADCLPEFGRNCDDGKNSQDPGGCFKNDQLNRPMSNAEGRDCVPLSICCLNGLDSVSELHRPTSGECKLGRFVWHSDCDSLRAKKCDQSVMVASAVHNLHELVSTESKFTGHLSQPAAVQLEIPEAAMGVKARVFAVGDEEVVDVASANLSLEAFPL